MFLRYSPRKIEDSFLLIVISPLALGENPTTSGRKLEPWKQDGRKIRTSGKSFERRPATKRISADASSFRKSAEVDELFKSLIKIVSDDTIVDATTFNEKFLHSGQLI